MDMANLPEKTTKSTELSTQEEFGERIADLMAEGWSIARIARRLYPDDPRKQKNMRAKLRRMSYNDPKFALAVGQRAKGQMLMDLIPAATAVGTRAKRGRIDAAKLLFETTGFHNPKVKHEHSGEIKVKLDIPRPQFDHEVSDADVVEANDTP